MEEKVANLGDELARKNLMIFELKRTVEEEKKNSELIRKVKGEEKSRFIWAVLVAVIPVLAVMWLW